MTKVHASHANPPRKPLGNSPLNAKTAFRRLPRTKPDVPSQGLLTTRTLRKSPIPVNPQPGNPQRIKAEQQCVSKVTCEQKNTCNLVYSQLRCKFWQAESYIQKREPTHQPSSGVARRLPPQLTLFCRYPPFVYKLDHKSKPHDRDRKTWRNILLIMDAKRETAVQKNSRLSAGRRPVGWLRQCRSFMLVSYSCPKRSIQFKAESNPACSLFRGPML